LADIKPYLDQSHRAQVLELFSDVPFKAELWNYQFLESPGAKTRGFEPIIAEDDGRTVGFNGVVPVSIVWNGAISNAMWSCDFKVSADYRGQGVGRLIKEALATKSPVLMSFGISPVAAIVLERMGWQASHEVHFLKKICRPATLRDIALSVFQLLTAAMHWSSGGAGLKTVQLDGLPDSGEVDRLWADVQAGYTKAVVRDWEYLDWRYQKHPLGRYRFVEVRDKHHALTAVGVVRVSGGQVRFVDYLGPARSVPVKRALVKAILGYWASANAFSSMTSDFELKRVMKSMGFYQGREQPRFYVWSSREMLGDNEPESSAQGWFIMGGDSDGELLQAARESWNEKVTDREGV